MAFGKSFGVSFFTALLMADEPSCVEHVLVVVAVEAVVFVAFAFLVCHVEDVQSFHGLFQSWDLGVRVDISDFEVPKPLFPWRGGHFGLVVLVDAKHVVFREDVVHGLHSQPFWEVAVSEDETVASVDSYELALTVVEVVVADAEVEIEDVDGEDLLDVLVVKARGNMLGDGLGGAVEDAFEEVEVVGLLYFDEDDLAEGVLGLDIDAVELVVLVAFVALAFEYFGDGDVLVEDGGDESLQDGEVGLVAEDVLGGPVETDDIVRSYHNEDELGVKQDNSAAKII